MKYDNNGFLPVEASIGPLVYISSLESTKVRTGGFARFVHSSPFKQVADEYQQGEESSIEPNHAAPFLDCEKPGGQSRSRFVIALNETGHNRKL